MRKTWRGTEGIRHGVEKEDTELKGQKEEDTVLSLGD